MAFATGHTAPSGFTAGQLRDGSSIGTFNIPSMGTLGTNLTLEVFLRYYNGLLIGETEIRTSGGTVVANESRRVKNNQYFANLAGGLVASQPLILKDLSGMVATAAQLQAAGVQDNGFITKPATSEPIPYQLTADGKVEKFTSEADKQKQQEELNKTLVQTLTQTTKTTSGGTTDTSGNPAWVKYLIWGAVAAVVVVAGVAIFKAVGKKGKKKKD